MIHLQINEYRYQHSTAQHSARYGSVGLSDRGGHACLPLGTVGPGFEFKLDTPDTLRIPVLGIRVILVRIRIRTTD